jgi:Fic family protein
MKPADNKQAVIETVAALPQGARVDAIAARLTGIPRRTLQRLLAELVQNGQLSRSGKGPATLYTLGQSSPEVETGEDYTTFINLSDTSRNLLGQLRRPLAARKPVAYQREWLAAYQPNKTFYLDENTRGLLRRVGDTGMTDSPLGTYGREILDRLLIDLSWASSRLEGNTYTRLDTERLICHGEEATGKDALESQMILNHKRAIEVLVESVAEVGFNRYTFLNLHGLLSENLMPDPTASGRLRQREVDISGTVYKPCAIPQLVEDCFHEILHKADLIRDPFEQAFFILVHLPYLQPFEDVNKRVARIGCNIAFIKHNLCPLTFVEVPEHAYVEGLLGVYEANDVSLLRDVFVWAYERSAQRYTQVKKTLAEPEPLRLKYRNHLHQLVGDVVRAGQTQYTSTVEAFAEKITENERAVFIAMALDDIRRLHEGVLVRYRLTPAEFRAWKDKLHV